jgi:hypothetical protein
MAINHIKSRANKCNKSQQLTCSRNSDHGIDGARATMSSFRKSTVGRSGSTKARQFGGAEVEGGVWNDHPR